MGRPLLVDAMPRHATPRHGGLQAQSWKVFFPSYLKAEADNGRSVKATDRDEPIPDQF